MRWRHWLLVITLAGCITQVETQFDETCPNPDDCGPGYHQAAGAEGSGFLGFNVVVTDAAPSQARLLAIASGYAERHPDERVVVALFDEGAGEERQEIEEAMLPGDPELQPAPPPVADHWLATFDFPAGAATPRTSQYSGQVAR